MKRLEAPTPRPELANPSLTRPDWTRSELRDPSKLWLDKNENVDPELASIVRAALSDLPVEAQWSYPDMGRLYAKVAKMVGADAENIILAAGSDGVIRAVFEAYVSPGDGVVLPEPTFAMYSVYAKMYGARVTSLDYEPSQGGPSLPMERVLAAIESTRPRLVCLPNPDSPTGATVDPSALRRVIEVAGAAGAVVLIDEAYYPFHTETLVGWVQDYPNLVVARSTAKAWGLAGFRIGYGVAAPSIAHALHQVRPMYEVGTVSAWMFERMLDHTDEVAGSVDRLLRGKATFLAALDDLGFATLRGAGNFLHVAFGDRAPAVHSALAPLVYYRKDFDHPSLSGYSRFSAATEAQFRPIIDCIREVSGKAR